MQGVDDLVEEQWDTVSRALMVRHNGNLVCQLVPLTADGTPDRPPAGPDTGELSRYAILRQVDGCFLIESPLAWCVVRLTDLSLLTSGDGLVWRYLRWAGMTADPADTADFPVAQWTPHELWFHHHTRIPGAHRDPSFGRTHWAKDKFDPVAARHPRYRGPGIGLARPDLKQLRGTDPSVAAVLEDRRSVRDHDDDQPITATQLGHLLFRAARNKWLVERGGSEYLSRPYPAGGSAYELEIYPVVRHVDGMDPGMYHYDPQDHVLRKVSGSTAELLADARTVAAAANPPQVLLVIAARFGRLMWTYRGMPYSLVLKHVGVLQQTLYTVATAMGLAACALGDGSSTAFAAATGADPRAEASVGEFVLGSRPAVRRRAPARE